MTLTTLLVTRTFVWRYGAKEHGETWREGSSLPAHVCTERFMLYLPPQAPPKRGPGRPRKNEQAPGSSRRPSAPLGLGSPPLGLALGSQPMSPSPLAVSIDLQTADQTRDTQYSLQHKPDTQLLRSCRSLRELARTWHLWALVQVVSGCWRKGSLQSCTTTSAR